MHPIFPRSPRRTSRPVLPAAVLAILFLLGGCATIVPPRDRIQWPDNALAGIVEYRPQAMKSPSVARTTLLRMAGSLFVDDLPVEEIDVDDARLIATAVRRTSAYRKVRVWDRDCPGGIECWDEEDAYWLPKVTTSRPIRSVAVFRDIRQLLLSADGTVTVIMDGGARSAIRAADQDGAQRLADAINTLCRAVGVHPDTGPDALFEPLTAQQAAALDLDPTAGGMLVTGVREDGAAARAGLRHLDVVLRVNDVPATEDNLSLPAPDGQPTSLDVLRWKGSPPPGEQFTLVFPGQ